MRARFVAVLVAALAGALVVACTANLSETGGEPRLGTASDDAGTSPWCAPGADAGSGSAWSDLYRDYFGPTGRASCAGNGQCHGDASQPGAIQSGGYVCGPTAASCYAGITNPSVGLVKAGDKTSDPTAGGLYGILRKCSGGGIMPREPASVMFGDGDMARIVDWLKAGAPND